MTEPSMRPPCTSAQRVLASAAMPAASITTMGHPRSYIRSATMEPMARIESGCPRTSAAGPVPRRSISASTELDEDDPMTTGMTTTRPVSEAPRCGWRCEVTTPRSASTPPHRLRGWSSTRTPPLRVTRHQHAGREDPRVRHRTASVPEPHDAARPSARDALPERPVCHSRAEVGGR